MSKKKLRREMARLKALGLQSHHPQAVGGMPTLASAYGVANTHTELSHAHQSPHAPVHPGERKHGWKAWLERIYEYEYRKLTYFTIIILVLAVLQIGYQVATTGDFINKGVSLKGGLTMTIPSAALPPDEMESALKQEFSSYDIAVRSITSAGGTKGLIIEADITDPDDIRAFRQALETKLGLQPDAYSVEQIGSTLGESFFIQIIISLIAAFILMAVMVIIWFRNLGPSMMVILAAFCDLVETIAVINIFGIKVSTGGIAALLMLIGYSVDTDILLSTRVLKRKEGTVYAATVDAFKTGMTMTLTAIAAVSVGYLASSSVVLQQIMLILFIGLIFDIFNTWIQNAALLRWYVDHQAKKKAAKEGAA